MHHISVGSWFHIDLFPVITFLLQKINLKEGRRHAEH
jgi:hypothetical protein